MPTPKLTALALACALLFVACEHTFTDTRDGKIYKTVKIGEQVWLAENLNYEADGSKCYKNDPAHCEKYGRLYNWATAMKACPKGWHLPSKEEWETLVDFVGGWETAGKYLKSKSGWLKNGNGEDKYGFSALPGGVGDSDGDFGVVGGYGYWWSATEEGGSPNADIMDMGYDDEGVYYDSSNKSYLLSVRCLQD
jgi:uncharacterized protein (TIGR02145 family)